MHWEIVKLTIVSQGTPCEGCDLQDNRLRWWITSESPQAVYHRPTTHVAGDLHLQIIGSALTAKVTEASSLTVTRLASTPLPWIQWLIDKST